MESLDIQAFTYEPRTRLVAELTAVLSEWGGWMLDRRILSPANMEFRIEIQLRAILDLYAALVASGIELTRSGHESLTGLCTRCNHMRLAADLGQIVTIRLQIRFFEGLTLHFLLSTGSALA